jgi:uncharacterized membrane protein (DUF373 family)
MDRIRKTDQERYVFPTKIVDYIEDVFHIALSIVLLAISGGALFFSVKEMLTTHPFFPNGMVVGINNILFIVIILEILRTIISRFTDGILQLDKFLVIGVIAAVRHILTVGASLTLESTKSDSAFFRDLWELGVDAGIVLLLVLAIFLSKMSQRSNQPLQTRVKGESKF